MIQNKCYICNGKGRNLCLASDKIICSACCGSKRGSDINCNPDCSYSPFSIKGYDLWLKTDANLSRKILKYISDVHDRAYFEKTMEHMSFKGSTPEHMEAAAAGAAVYYLLFIKRDEGNQTLAECWKNSSWQGLTNDEKVMMNYRFNSRATVIEIQKILDNQAMECIDLLDPEKGAFILLDRGTAAVAVRFTRLFTWLTHYPNFSRPENNGVEITDFIADDFMNIAQRGFEKEVKKYPDLTIKHYLSENFGSFCELVFNLAHKKSTAVLKRMDMHQCKAFYAIEGKSAYNDIKTILDNYPDFKDRERNPEEKHADGAFYYSWLRKGDSKALEKKMNPVFQHDDEDDSVGSLGNITLYPDKLVIETFTKQKYAFAKKMVKKYFKNKVTLQNEAIVDLAKQLAAKNELGEESYHKEHFPESGPRLKTIPPEIERGLMYDFYEKRYKKFIDEQIPMLDNLTPRQAANDPKMRPRLVELMKQHLKGIEKQNKDKNLDLNIDWVLDELKIAELK